MAALVCDLCGGKLVMGSGGIATCDSCGMEHSADRMKEKVQEIKGVVQVDNTHMIDNYLRMAQNAYDSNNKQEAVNYCNKIIEILPNHQQAWLLKGRAAGWQSTLGNIRFAEAINCFAHAIENTPDEEKDAIIDECKQEVSNLAQALIRLRGERFEKWPDEEERDGFINDLTVILQAILQFFEAIGTLINKDELMAPLAGIIKSSVINAWNNVVLPKFENDHDGYPDDYELTRLINRAGYCTDLLEKATGLSESDFENDVKCYESLITINKVLINAQSYVYKTVQIGNSKIDGRALYDNRYVKSKSLTDEAKNERKQRITTYEEKIKERKTAGFWDKYREEYKFLTEELDKSKTECTKLIEAKTGHTKIEQLKNHIAAIEKILKRDREITWEISKSEKEVIENCEVFWETLSSTSGEYDAYLDQNPILKQAPELKKQREQLVEVKKSIDRDKNKNSVTSLVGTIVRYLLLIAVFLFGCVAGGFIACMGFIFVIVIFCLFCHKISEYVDNRRDIQDREKQYKEEATKYNAVIDEMLAVPEYEGEVNPDVKVKIPEKL